MRTLTNGAPKTGTHALQRAVQLFGLTPDEAVHDHVNYADKDKTEKYDRHIHIIRSPRNVLVSYIRWTDRGHPNAKDALIKHMPRLIAFMERFKPWIYDDSCMTVRYEDLMTDRSTLERIGEYIGMPVVEDHFELMFGRTHTFSADFELDENGDKKPWRPSRWQDYWKAGDEVDQLWHKLGGGRLEREMLYDPNQQHVRDLNAH